MAKKLITHDVKVAGDIVKVDIHVDTGSGVFSAKVGEDSCETHQLPELKEWITKAVKAGKAKEITYAPFIEIFRVDESDRGYGRDNYQTSLRFGFTALLLSTEVYEETTSRRGSKEVERYRLRRLASVNEKTFVVEHDEAEEKRSWGFNNGREGKRRSEDTRDDRESNRTSTIVPYTAQRYQALCAIRDKIGELRERLNKMLVQTAPADASAVLDGVSVMALLAPVETPKSAKKKR